MSRTNRAKERATSNPWTKRDFVSDAWNGDRTRIRHARRLVFCTFCSSLERMQQSFLYGNITKRDESIRPTRRRWSSSYELYQASECPRYVLLIILLSDFRIINVLVLPTNQKPLLQWIQVTRCALSPFTSFENRPAQSRFQRGFNAVLSVKSNVESVLSISLDTFSTCQPRISPEYISVYDCFPCIDRVFHLCTYVKEFWIN